MPLAPLEEGVWETTQSVGTSAVTLEEKDGFRRFGDAYASGTTRIPYRIQWVGGFEAGEGTYTLSGSTHTLSRNTVLKRYDDASGLVSLPSGEKQVYVELPGDYLVTTQSENTFEEDQTFAAGVRQYFGDDADTYAVADDDDVWKVHTLGEEQFAVNGPSDRVRIRSVKSTNADGPELRLYRASPSPANADDTGVIRFTCNNSVGTEVSLAKIRSWVDDVNSGSEDGRLSLEIAVAGTLTGVIGWISGFTYLGSGQGLLTGGKTASSVSTAGCELLSTGQGILTASGATPLTLNRLANDGTLIDFQQATTSEGSISVSGTTVSLNGATIAHDSVWADGPPPALERGTVLETADARLAPDDPHPRVRLAQPGSRRVYGVFAHYLPDSGIRVYGGHIGEVLAKGPLAGGDLLCMSDEPGIAGRQSLTLPGGEIVADDVVRATTICKVSVGDAATGVRLVPCVLYCG